MSFTEVVADGTILGDVPGILLGTFFRSRQDLYDKKLHRALMSGIAPHGSSIVLSGCRRKQSDARWQRSRNGSIAALFSDLSTATDSNSVPENVREHRWISGNNFPLISHLPIRLNYVGATIL